MDLQHVLLSTSGRIGPRDFLRGLVLLTGACVIIMVAASVVSPEAGILQSALVFPYVCVFGKRLHDAGQTAWLYLVFLMAFFILSSVIQLLLMPLLSPDAYKFQMELFGHALAGNADAINNMDPQRVLDFNRLSAATNLAAFLAASAVLGLVGARLPSNPRANAYGPATRGHSAPDRS